MTHTLKTLAETLNGKYWEKGDKKRIYLDRGHNTRKMKTTTYVEQRGENFVVKCFIDCPSQGWNWIKSQQEEIIQSVEEDIEMAIAEFIYVVVDADDNYLSDNDPAELGELYSSDIYLSEEGCESYIEEEGLTGCSVKKISKGDYEVAEKELYAASND